MSAANTVFIIGFPYTPARQVAERLGQRADISTVLLVAEKTRNDATQFVAQFDGNMSLLTGSLDRIDFGLSGSNYLALADRISTILHLQPPVAPTHRSQISQARNATREVIELALTAKDLQHLIVLSHVDIAGNWAGLLTEQDLELGQTFTGAAQEDRFRSERIFRRFEQQLPITILRPGWLVGTHTDGCPLATLLLTAEDASALPTKELNRPLFFTETDVLSLITAKAIDEPPTNGIRTVHLTTHPPPTVGSMAKRVREIAIKSVPEGFDLATGARRVLHSRRGQRWTPKEFFKQQPFRANVSTALSDRFLNELKIPPTEQIDDVITRITNDAVEKIIGFKG